MADDQDLDGRARCVRCGCTDDEACPGGCSWVAGGMVDVCSACAGPEPVLLEGCVCGEHVHCPDGWHDDSELPYACTPDCALGDDWPDDVDEAWLVRVVDVPDPQGLLS